MLADVRAKLELLLSLLAQVSSCTCLLGDWGRTKQLPATVGHRGIGCSWPSCGTSLYMAYGPAHHVRCCPRPLDVTMLVCVLCTLQMVERIVLEVQLLLPLVRVALTCLSVDSLQLMQAQAVGEHG